MQLNYNQASYTPLFKAFFSCLFIISAAAAEAKPAPEDYLCGKILTSSREAGPLRSYVNNLIRRTQKKISPDFAINRVEKLWASLKNLLPPDMAVDLPINPFGSAEERSGADFTTLGKDARMKVLAKAETILNEISELTKEIHGENSEEAANVHLAFSILYVLAGDEPRSVHGAIAHADLALHLFERANNYQTAIVHIHLIRQWLREENTFRSVAVAVEADKILEYLNRTTLTRDAKTWVRLNASLIQIEAQQPKNGIILDETLAKTEELLRHIKTQKQYLPKLLRERGDGVLARIMTILRTANHERQSVTPAGPPQSLMVRRTVLLTGLQRNLKQGIEAEQFLQALREMHYEE